MKYFKTALYVFWRFLPIIIFLAFMTAGAFYAIKSEAKKERQGVNKQLQAEILREIEEEKKLDKKVIERLNI